MKSASQTLSRSDGFSKGLLRGLDIMFIISYKRGGVRRIKVMVGCEGCVIDQSSVKNRGSEGGAILSEN